MAKQAALVSGVGSEALKRIILADAPMGYWVCDETSGPTIYDYSGNGYDLTQQNTLRFADVPLIPGDDTKFLTIPNGGVNGADRAGLLGVTPPLAGAFSFECLALRYSASGAEQYVFAFAGSGETTAVNLQFSFQLDVSPGARVFWESGAGTDRAYNTGAAAIIAACIPMHWLFTMSAAGVMNFYLNGRRLNPTTSAIVRPTGGTGAMGTCIGRSPTYLNASVGNTQVVGHVAFYSGVELDRFAARRRAIAAGLWGTPL